MTKDTTSVAKDVARATHDAPNSSGHLVVVGSSAGGIEALSVLVAGLSPNFSAPIVLAQHLDPNRPSHLQGILERRSSLPIQSVSGDTELQAGHVYVVPSNRHVVIHDGTVGLEADHGDRPLPSIDLLLSTAARSYGEKLIAVILTGSGSDGAAGAVEVKEAGGCVVIQNPRTAAHPSMPSALPPTAVDHVVDLDQIAPLLFDILRGTVIEKRIESGDREALDGVLGVVTRQGNIDFRQYKSSTILRRIGRRMALSHTHTLEDYRDYLSTRPDEVVDLVKSLLIKVTEFFRDPEAFGFLEHEVMPRMIQLGREQGRVLRLWSAGCATGEEAYSLVLLLANMLGRELPEWSIKVFATDADDDAINYARRGYYPANVLRHLPEEYKTRFFEPTDHGFRIGKSLRQMIIFGQQDLSRGVPFPRIDLISCRNLLIYFKPELQQSVLDLFAYSLHQTQGFLFLGKAETARPSRSVYELVNKKWKVYRCVSGPLPLPVRPPYERVRKDTPRLHDTYAATAEPSRPAEPRQVDDADLRRTNELLLRALPTGICIIDRNYRILSINATARRLLGVRDPATDQDFLHAVRGLPYGDVRTAIDRAFRERSVAVISQLEMDNNLGDARYVTLQVIPFEGWQVEAVVICVENVTDLVQTQRRLEAVQSEQSQLADDLGAANHRLVEVNKDLQDANEELQAANEEMMLSQEELQATNEEFEATNEELQATNEEMETNNEELQATNEELETTNEELQARTSELQELTRILTGERVRLREIVERAPFHILLLRGPELVVESINPPQGFMFRGMELQHPFEETSGTLELEPVRLGVRRCFVDNATWHSNVISMPEDGTPRFYLFTAVPTHDEKGHVDGVVLYVEDVSDRELRAEEEKLGKVRIMLDHATELAMGLFDANGRLLHASVAYLHLIEQIHGIDPAEALGMNWEELWFGHESNRGAFAKTVREAATHRLQEVRGTSEEVPSIWDCSLIPITTDRPISVNYVVFTAVEITRAVLAREALEQVDRIKDSFLSLASHELRTPLTPLAAYVELLSHLMSEKRRDPEWERQMQEVVSKFRRQIGYLSRLTEDLVDISRIRSGRLSLDLRPVDLRRVVEEGRDQAQAMGPATKIQIDVKGNGHLKVVADEMRLIQVVYNLLSNAMKHAPASDGIQVAISERRHENRRWGRVEVADKGPGVPESYREDLFVRFMRPTIAEPKSARSGLGLGLFITARIVEQHGGRIGAEHRDGSTFWFELPLMD